MAVGIVIVKKSYRHGNYDEEWSNKYHLSGSDPTTPAEWKTLFDALVLEEKKLYSSLTNVVRAYGYTDDSDTATAAWSIDMTVSPNVPVPGTLTSGTTSMAPSDIAVWIRWKLDRNNSNGKPIFLRKYFHDVWLATAGAGSTVDQYLPGQKTALNAFASLLFTGAGVDGRHIRDTHGGNVIAAGVSTFVTTRTLKRRGKRP